MSELVQVNSVMENEEVVMLDLIAKELSLDGRINRSATVRWLIRQEHARRYSTPNPLVSIEHVELAANREAQS